MTAPTPAKLTINGKLYEVDPGVAVGSKLVDFLHSKGLTGTHFTCLQGGCGSCTVVGKHTDPSTGEKKEYAFNSCLAMVHACDGWEITTVEGLGNRHDGYHVVQDRLADFSGTQCGFCSPGMVMNMYGLTQQKKEGWSASDAEHLLDGNLCRCTGYRPILDAWKSITTQDIEDLPKCGKSGGCCKKKGKVANSGSKHGCKSDTILPRDVVGGGVTLYQPDTLQALYDILNSLGEGTTYKLTCGNTGQGIYKDDGYMAYINTRTVTELNTQEETEEGLVFGSSVSIADVITALEKAAETTPGYSHAALLAKHWRHVASTQIRNLGSWAGNLGLKTTHHEFPSDIFISLVGTDATITTGLASDGSVTSHRVEDLLTTDFSSDKQLMLKLKIPPMSDDVVYRSYKIMPRAAWAHAVVNAVFKIQVDRDNQHTVIGTPTIAFGGINPTFIHAHETETLLSGASLEDPSVLQAAMASLASEILPDNEPIDASPEYRVALTQNLLYKTIVGIVGNVVGTNIINGATDLERPLSHGTQTYDQNTDFWPVGQAIPKLEAKIQCSGEAEYIAIMPKLPNELEGRFVQATQGDAEYTIDASEALLVPGVIGFISVDDITGVNDTVVDADASYICHEELFPSERVQYYGQALGMIVGETLEACEEGVAKVKVSYSDIKAPVTEIEEAMNNPMCTNMPKFIVGDVEVGFAASAHIIEGAMTRDGQFHFSMETQVTRAIPTEDGLDIFCSTQWAMEAQNSIAQVLGISPNSINLSVKRIGGGFGAKIDRCNLISTATALAAYKLKRPVKCHLDLKTNMTMIGGRDPFHCSYKIGVDADGVLQAVEAYMTCDSGYGDLGASSPGAAFLLPSCYQSPNWRVVPQIARTNTAQNTWCRAPGWVDSIVHIENMLEHVSVALGLDPLEMRKKNLMVDGGTRNLVSRVRNYSVQEKPTEMTIPRNLISTMLDQMISKAEVDRRKQEVLDYNKANMWKKRGLCVMPMLFPYGIPANFPYAMPVLISIYKQDGTVSISHGGVEMGQGINTKVAQVAAYELGCPVEMIKIKATNTHSNANSQCDGGSLGSDFNAFCAQEAAKLLRARLDAAKEDMLNKDPSWVQVVHHAYNTGVDLSQRYNNQPGEVKDYAIFAVACAEVHLDVLTGQFLVTRTDILQDAGISMSPLVDIGQIEGAWVMGQGLFTCEQLKFHPTTGERITNDTWTYKIPTGLDIPIDFRIEMLSNTPNPLGVKSSKVTGEPPLCLSYSVALALRQAVASARADRGVTGWFRMDTPLTIERLQQHCLVDPMTFTFT